MSLGLNTPTLRQLADAPERAILCVLAACAQSAESMLLHTHSELFDLGDLRSDDPPPTPPAAQVAAGLLLGDIAKLKNSLSLYEASVTATILAGRYENRLF